MSCKEKVLLNSSALSVAWGIGVISSLMVIFCVKLTLSLCLLSHVVLSPHKSSLLALQPDFGS